MRMILFAGALAVPLSALGTDPAAAGGQVFSATLARTEPWVSAHAKGQAKFWLSSDGGEIRFIVTVENLESFTQAHIHLAPDALSRGSFPRRFRESSGDREHGPIVVFLTDFIREGITVNGVLSEGTIGESDLLGPLRGHPLSLLIEFMENGDAYVAVHTLKPIAPGRVFCCPDTLRGLIRAEHPQ